MSQSVYTDTIASGRRPVSSTATAYAPFCEM